MPPFPAIAAPSVDRIVAIASRTASAADGEALNAARLLNRELGRAGLRIEDIFRRGLTTHDKRGGSSTARPTADHAVLAAESLVTASIFNVTELAFLKRMSGAARATPAQFDWLLALAARSRQFRSATAGVGPC